MIHLRLQATHQHTSLGGTTTFLLLQEHNVRYLSGLRRNSRIIFSYDKKHHGHYTATAFVYIISYQSLSLTSWKREGELAGGFFTLRI